MAVEDYFFYENSMLEIDLYLHMVAEDNIVV
jgi:hypothetical protein